MYGHKFKKTDRIDVLSQVGELKSKETVLITGN